MPIITLGDFSELFYKIQTRGLCFIRSKFSINKKLRTKSTWNVTEMKSANWWMIPAIRKRWNYLISGDESIDLQQYVVEKYFKNNKELIALSPACGSGAKELVLAQHQNFKLIEAFDISEKLIDEANQEREKLGLDNIKFFVKDFYEYSFPNNKYDLILFISSLHHFIKIENVIEKVYNAIKNNGYLVIFEYVGSNRFQYKKSRHKIINTILLQEIPAKFRKKFITGSIKKFVPRIGRLRMILSDPSEAPCSEDILPAIYKYFNKCEEKKIGGDLLAYILKDIAHNFTEDNIESMDILKRLFKIEDEYLISRPSDKVFGVYKKEN